MSGKKYSGLYPDQMHVVQGVIRAMTCPAYSLDITTLLSSEKMATLQSTAAISAPDKGLAWITLQIATGASLASLILGTSSYILSSSFNWKISDAFV